MLWEICFRYGKCHFWPPKLHNFVNFTKNCTIDDQNTVQNGQISNVWLYKSIMNISWEPLPRGWLPSSLFASYIFAANIFWTISIGLPARGLSGLIDIILRAYLAMQSWLGVGIVFLNKRYEIRLTPPHPPFVKFFHKIPLFLKECFPY